MDSLTYSSLENKPGIAQRCPVIDAGRPDSDAFKNRCDALAAANAHRHKRITPAGRCSSYKCDGAMTADQLIKAADSAMHEAKHAERNCLRLPGAGIGEGHHEVLQALVLGDGQVTDVQWRACYARRGLACGHPAGAQAWPIQSAL